MADCNPGSNTLIIAGSGIDVEGSGTVDDPYVVSRFDSTPPDWQESRSSTVFGLLPLNNEVVPVTLRILLTDNSTISLPIWPADRSGTITLVITQDSTGGRTLNWGLAGILTSGTLALSTAANAVDVVTLFWTGANWIGMLAAKQVTQ